MSVTTAVARPSQALRQRRESQRPGPTRANTKTAATEVSGSPKQEKRYLTTAQDILRKFSGKPPSLRVYLYQNHFRINDAAESLSYASPLKELLQHIRDKTIPHNMLEEFYASGIPFYDNTLIVEVHDYKSAGAKPQDNSSRNPDGTKQDAFSIHNYNNFITPSPHVPFPLRPKDATQAQQTTPSKASVPAKAAEKEDKENKENLPAPGQSASQKQAAKAKVTTVVLFPTPMSELTDIQLLATTPAPDIQTYRRNQAVGRTASTPTMAHPPTPLTAIPPTPTLSTGRSPKRQKMVIDESNVYEFESELYLKTAPKLFLEPTEDLHASLELMVAMTHPNNLNPPPPRKARKRTTAELAADEAEEADRQRFMLAGDEWQDTKTASAATGDEGQSRGGAANFQTFSRFKTLASIKSNHEEAERRKKQEEAQLLFHKRQAQADAEDKRKKEQEVAAKQAEHNQHLLAQAHRREQMLAQQQRQQLEHQQEALRQASQAQSMANVAAAQFAQTPQSQTQQSPVVRQQTPMASSPLVTAHVTHPMGGAPMAATTSSHGAGSPARPPSSISHHPTNMARSASQQQNVPSRNGTPAINATPIMNSAMPARNMTPQPRMQGSPTVPMQGGTPVMMQTPQGTNLTQEQLQIMNRQRLARMAQQNMQGSPTAQMEQLAVMKARQHVATQGIPQGQNPQAYQSRLVQRFLQQMTLQNAAAAQQQQNMQLNNASPQNAGQMRPDMPQAGFNQGQVNPMAGMTSAQLKQQYMAKKAQLQQTFGNQVPPQYQAQMQSLETAIHAQEARERQQQAGAHLGNGVNLMGNGMSQQAMQQTMAMNSQNANPAQMQQYQQLLQQQRARQQAQQQQMMAQMRQQGLQGQMPSMGMGNMMNGMQGGMNMNMANMQNMQNMGMQNMGMSPQQMQQMMMMQRAQAAQQQRGQQRPSGQGQQNDGMEWSGV